MVILFHAERNLINPVNLKTDKRFTVFPSEFREVAYNFSVGRWLDNAFTALRIDALP